MKSNNLQLAVAQVQTSLPGFKKLKLPEKIITDKDHKMASDAVKYLNDKIKYAEEIRTKYTKPLLDEKKGIDGQFKRLTAPLEDLMDKVKKLMLDYMKVKQIEQAEYEKKMMADNIGQDLVVVDDLVGQIKQGDVSSNYLKTTIKYRTKDTKLRDAVVIKVEAFRTYLEDNTVPGWVEVYEEENIVIRTK